jgi:hypothetical protein
MTPVWWMAGVSICSWLAATALAGKGPELFLGMIAPLVVATVTWVLAERTYRRNPERLTALMVAAFGAKMVVFGTYVAIVLKVLSLRPVPFVVSFTGYFIALHLAEALSLRRLFAEGMHLTHE